MVPTEKSTTRSWGSQEFSHQSENEQDKYSSLNNWMQCFDVSWQQGNVTNEANYLASTLKVTYPAPITMIVHFQLFSRESIHDCAGASEVTPAT